MSKLNILAIETLQGGDYDLSTVLKVISNINNTALKVGVALIGLSAIVGFIMLGIVDVEQKEKVKARLKQTFFGLIGMILAISLVNFVIKLFN